eukprot:TRINITY_DN5719_c0_g1_i7.p1 TRINITY_DN5719_c0_g1~~TRINITY_DN5719_c0_g1_i7.p1  ORF type:complete len:308 (-),score=41.93 TRINITY_DN5719_c0_g1_i7:528-1451(-)
MTTTQASGRDLPQQQAAGPPPAPPVVAPTVQQPTSATQMPDMRLLHNLGKFDGNKDAWPTWSFSFLAFVGTWNASIRAKLVQATAFAQRINMNTLSAEERSEARMVMFVLSQVLTSTALLIVMNVSSEDPENGFEAWRRLARQSGPSSAVTLVVILLRVLQFKIGEDMSAIPRKIEELESLLARFESASSDVLPDLLHPAILISALPPSLQDAVAVREFEHCRSLKQSVLQVVQARSIASGSPDDVAPAALNAMTWPSKGKGKGKTKTTAAENSKAKGKGDKRNIQCNWCWLWGRTQRTCWSKQEYE